MNTANIAADTADTATADSFVSMRLSAGINNKCLKNPPISKEELESLWNAICEASNLHSTPGMCYLEQDNRMHRPMKHTEMSILQELNFQCDESDCWSEEAEQLRLMAMLFLYYSLGGE